MKPTKTEIKLHGVPASPGIAIGTALVLGSKSLQIEKRNIQPDDVEHEILIFESALDKAREQIDDIWNELFEDMVEEASD